MANLMFPVWRGRYMYRESFLPLSGEDGRVEDITLLYPAVRIEEVLSADLRVRFEEGRDYTLVDGRLHIPETSAIPHMTWEEYYPPEAIPGGTFERTGGGYIRFSEGAFYHERQMVVSYVHEGSWPGSVPPGKLNLLPRTEKKLTFGEPIRVVFFGDSITARANASAMTGISPFQPDWCQLTCETLEERYGCPVTRVNTAVGGTTTRWGVEEVNPRAAEQKPDLLVLGFGMNDAGGIETEEYLSNLKAIMGAVLRLNPACEVVLMSTMLPNREAKGFFARQKEYQSALYTLEKRGVAVCDMTDVHEALLKRKADRDMTGNNVNHPNDFLSRVYAQTLLKTLGVH